MKVDAGKIGRAGCVLAVIGTFVTPPLANVGVALALGGAVLQPARLSRLHEAAAQPLCRAAVALLAVFALAMTWSAAPWSERLHALVSWRHLLLIPAALMLFTEDRHKQRFALSLVLATTLAALVAWGTWIAGTTLQPPRSPGVLMRNHSTQSMALAVGVLLALVLAAKANGINRAWRFGLMICAATNLSLLLLITPGRSGQLALLAMAVVVALQSVERRWRLATLVAVPLLAAAVVATSPLVLERFSTGMAEMKQARESTNLTSMGIRVVMWENTWAMIAQRPLLGSGLGGFSGAYAAQAAEAETGWRATPTVDPHNQLLQVTAEAGLLGMAALLAFVAASIMQRPPQPWRMAGLAVLAGWCVTSQFSSHFNTFAEGHMVMLLLGTLLARNTSRGLPNG